MSAPRISTRQIHPSPSKKRHSSSVQYDLETPRLSIADRFMSPNFPPSPTKTAQSLTNSLAALSTSFDTPTSRIIPSFTEQMVVKSYPPTTTSSRATSFLDLEPIDSNSRSKPTPVHPLDLEQPVFETNRQWESKDGTLFHAERKKSIFTDSEKHTSTPFSLNDYYLDNDGKSEHEEIHMKYADMDEEKKEYVKRPPKKQKRDTFVDETNRGCWIACCYISCRKGCSRRGWVFCIFISLIVLVLSVYFLWPRTPLMRIEGASLTTPAKLTETKQGVLVGNVAFESEWLVNITVDNRQNHVPTQLTRIQIIAKDALTGLIIGKGVHNEDQEPESVILSPSSISTIQVPIRIDYQARDSTDTTFVDLGRACSPGRFGMGSQREALPLHFWITLHFFGLDWLGYKPTVIATPATGGFACPLS